jgi:hypothetical protein
LKNLTDLGGPPTPKGCLNFLIPKKKKNKKVPLPVDVLGVLAGVGTPSISFANCSNIFVSAESFGNFSNPAKSYIYIYRRTKLVFSDEEEEKKMKVSSFDVLIFQ